MSMGLMGVFDFATKASRLDRDRHRHEVVEGLGGVMEPPMSPRPLADGQTNICLRHARPIFACQRQMFEHPSARGLGLILGLGNKNYN
jgi:hypothetical protein